jgi:hypothetical protein
MRFRIFEQPDSRGMVGQCGLYHAHALLFWIPCEFAAMMRVQSWCRQTVWVAGTNGSYTLLKVPCQEGGSS